MLCSFLREEVVNGYHTGTGLGLDLDWTQMGTGTLRLELGDILLETSSQEEPLSRDQPQLSPGACTEDFVPKFVPLQWVVLVDGGAIVGNFDQATQHLTSNLSPPQKPIGGLQIHCKYRQSELPIAWKTFSSA